MSALMIQEENRFVELENEHVQVCVARSYGPRIVRYAVRGGENVLGEVSPREQGVETDALCEIGHRVAGRAGEETSAA